MSKFTKVGIGGRYGMHSGSGKFKNVEVVNNLNVRGISFPLIQGDVRYVDSANATTGDGTTWLKAFSTITEAVAAANAYDTILVAGTDAQDSSSDPVSDYTEQVTIPATKMGLRIIGMGNGPEGVLWEGESDEVILTINAKDCYISGIRFRPNGAATAGAIFLAKNVDLTACANGTTIRNCIFRSTTATAIFGIETEGANDVLVEGCVFSSVVTAILQDATPNAVTYRMIIRDCLVDRKCTNGFLLDGDSCLIKNNDLAGGLTLIVKTDAVGAAGSYNIVTDNNFDTGDSYETKCSGHSDDNWMGNMCDDTSNTDVTSDGFTTDYPHQA